MHKCVPRLSLCFLSIHPSSSLPAKIPSSKSHRHAPRFLFPVNRYRLIGKKGEGTFSEVLKAQGIKNGKYVAIKCMKNHFDSLDQVNNLREIQALRRLSPHPHHQAVRGACTTSRRGDWRSSSS